MGSKLTAPHGSLGHSFGLHQFMSLTEGLAPLFECFNPPLASHPPHLPTCPPPIDSICDITGTEKAISKTSIIQI